MLPSPSSCRSASFPSYALLSLSKTTTNMRSISLSPILKFHWVRHLRFMSALPEDFSFIKDRCLHADQFSVLPFVVNYSLQCEVSRKTTEYISNLYRVSKTDARRTITTKK